MPEKSVYDSRFFIEYFYSGDVGFLRRLKEDLRAVKKKMVSALTVHEVHHINLEREGREVTILFYEQLTHLRRRLQVLKFKTVVWLR